MRIHDLTVIAGIVAFCAGAGCDAPNKAQPDPPVPAQSKAFQVTGDLQFFCDWERFEDAFATAKADYDAGKRRFADAWAVLSSRSLPGGTPDKQSMCWEGAILYLGVFGSRAELPQLIALAEKDSLLAAETTDPGQFTGISDYGKLRAVVQRSVYLALAAQLRRQLIFDGSLDTNAKVAEGILEDCAQDHDKCLPDTAMHLFRKQRHQRHAIRGLAISGTASNVTVFSGLQANYSSLDRKVRFALTDAGRMKKSIENNLSLIQSAVPAP